MGYLDKEAAITALQEMEGTEFVVRTKEKEEEVQKNVLDNVVPVEVDKKIGDRISELHSQYDTDIFELTGLKKEPNQKTYDFNKKVISDLKKDSESLATLTIDHDELKKSKGKGDENLASELEQVKAQALTAKSEYDAKVLDYETKITGQEKGFSIDKAIAGLKLNENIPESVRKSYIAKVRSDLIGTSEMQEGKLVFLKDGKPILDKEFNIKSVNDIVAEQLIDILGKGKTGLNLKDDKNNPIEISLPDHVKDKDSLIAHMKTIPGLDMHSTKWDEMYKALSKNF